MASPSDFIAFYDQIPLGILVVARDRQKLKVLYANQVMRSWPSLKTYLGMPLAQVLVGKQPMELIRSLQRQRPPSTTNLLLDERWLRVTIREDKWMGQDAYILWCDDISDDKAAERRLQDAIKEADAAAELKSNFLATMSHEMRTPMQSVYGLLELIALEKPPTHIMEMVNTAKKSSVGLLEILDDILDLAKIDADKMELDMFEVPLRTLARGVLEAMAVRAKGKDIILKDDIDPGVPFVIVGDPKRLRQIIVNLTSNALKFTETGSVTLRITRDTQHLLQDEKHKALRFEVKDTGIGMTPEVSSRLFKAFTQADNSTARKFGGTGLGLSICKKLVELMGGMIGVISRPGRGSIFWFEIPAEEVSTTATILEMPDLSGISVLSVEDHPQGAKEIVNSLRSMGAAVESCGTYQEALALVKRRPFDVAVVDQGLPDGLGLDLIREFMNLRPFMGVMMYTVRDDVGLQHSLQNLGVRYLAKPASRIGLGEAIAEAAMASAKIQTSSGGPTRLLIAEDTATVRDLIKRQLDKLGAEADFVTNGREAIEALKTGKYGILFTDLHMPEMDGYAVVESIRAGEQATNAHFPVIVLTADVQMAQRQVYLGYGFDECLLKPVSLGHFRRLLIRWGLLREDSMPAGETQKAAPAISPFSEDKPPAIDINAITEQMGAMDDSAREMLGFFVDMTQPVLERLRAGQTARDFKEIREAAHSLKGAARSACALHLGDLAAKAQDDAEHDVDTEKLVDQIFEEFERVKIAIRSL